MNSPVAEISTEKNENPAIAATTTGQPRFHSCSALPSPMIVSPAGETRAKRVNSNRGGDSVSESVWKMPKRAFS
ncbi:hypothetical protein GCM10017612_47590 [Novosphingobium resinovorum]|nr:hypothetical protein GCM10017612_47590 [Novosphingobium resinovorum]